LIIIILTQDLGSMAWFDVQGDGMPLYESTIPHHDCSGNQVAKPTLAPTTSAQDGADKCKIFDGLPFTADAMQFCAYSDNTMSNIGDGECGDGPVDAKINTNTNQSCESDCFIGFTIKGEFVTFKFLTYEEAEGITVKILVASNKQKGFKLTLVDENIESPTLFAPGEGFKMFEEVTWRASGEKILEGLHRLRLDFLDDNINVCSISVEIDTSTLSPIILLPDGNITEDNADFITTFCVIADVPYTQVELNELPNQIATQMEGCEFLVHLGDMFKGGTECNINDYIIVQDAMLHSHVPVFVVPGDNEWNDCQSPDIGWDHWIGSFLEFENNWNHTFEVIRQPDYEENFYFIHKRTLVFGLNIVGGRVHDDIEWQTRLKSEFLWVKSVMKLNLINLETADGVILMAHAHPSKDHQEFFNAFRMFIENGLKNKFPVLYLHGDGHNFLNTPNFYNQSNFLRIQHEGGTNEPVLKIMAGPKRTGRRTNAYNAFVYDRQLELMNNNNQEIEI
jgi:hypothetical protein